MSHNTSWSHTVMPPCGHSETPDFCAPLTMCVLGTLLAHPHAEKLIQSHLCTSHKSLVTSQATPLTNKCQPPMLKLVESDLCTLPESNDVISVDSFRLWVSLLDAEAVASICRPPLLLPLLLLPWPLTLLPEVTEGRGEPPSPLPSPCGEE